METKEKQTVNYVLRNNYLQFFVIFAFYGG